MKTPRKNGKLQPVNLVSILLLCWLLSDSNASSSSSRRFSSSIVNHNRPRIFGWRGGSLHSDQQSTEPSAGNNSNNVTVEDYVAAMKAKDCKDRLEEDDEGDDGTECSISDSPPPSSSLSSDDPSQQEVADSNQPEKKDGEEDDDPASVGVKEHSHNNSGKKSNAVGDPDGDDDDDSDDSLSEYSEEWEELEEFDDFMDGMVVDPPVQVEVEVMESEEDDDDFNTDRSVTKSSSGGGVGVRLGRMNNRRKQNSSSSPSSSSWRTTSSGKMSKDQKHLLEAWMPHLYFPPTPSGLAYLTDNARLLEASSKSRLDRRTLYASLLLEWGNGKSKQSKSARKFLPGATSQALQAALSMATQPLWRQSAPRTSGIRLYSEEENAKTLTLGMQETIAMALAHSLGCGMLILDDHVINKVRQQMIHDGLSDEELKPAALLRSILIMAGEGKLNRGKGAGSISTCMKRDLLQGLDDPYDERAAISCDDMVKWEEESEEQTPNNEKSSSEKSLQLNSQSSEKPLPLLIFVRTGSSTSLLKSKSVMELLIQECSSNDGIHLIALGKGIDATTATLPKDLVSDDHREPGGDNQAKMPGQAPWFGFSPQNQNASGQNDPEGSRRFNIFLARTVDHEGQPGILGAIAPPQAGNLFPHMMTMQARERLQNSQDEDSDARAELERWAHMMKLQQQQMQQQMQQQQQMQPYAGNSDVPPPQFFNASLAYSGPVEDGQQPPPPPPEVIEQTLQQAMSELLDRLSQMKDENDDSAEASAASDLHKAFSQVLRNDNLRRGIAENLARAAPALSDPKCQGVMLSVFVPPAANMNNMNRGRMSGSANGRQQGGNMGGWFHKIIKNQEQEEAASAEGDEESAEQKKNKRVRTMAAAAAVAAAKKSKDSNSGSEKSSSSESKAVRNLAKLESICRKVGITTPQDPVRAKSWESWMARERGAVIFRQNRKVLNEELASRNLELEQHTGTRGAGSALRQMLSVRDISSEMEEVVKCAVELEAAKSLRQHETSEEMHERETSLDIDISLSQLVLGEDGTIQSKEEPVDSLSVKSTRQKKRKTNDVQFVHPSSLETALSMKCRLSPSPSGGLSVASTPVSHRSKDEISALAQDKHERALISQVVSPHDIGVTYDMIGGLGDVKELLRQSITYPLKFPHLYSEGIAREAVKGVLLFGPPGTGKTMLAKAVATEGGASFLSVDASSVENKWLGESEKNAKAVFTLARRLAPCVIFIDEVDSLLSSREGSSDDSAHGTLTSVKTTMMSEWDGLNSGTNGSGDRVVVIGSTNRPFDLDEAVLRRFPRRILVDLPDLETRTEILEVTLAENRVDSSVNVTQIAERLEGYTGSDIKEVCREAVVQISHEQARLLDQGFINSKEDVTEGSLQRLRPVTMEDFEKALSKLKRSVSEKGRELARVWEWNDEYGEIKKEKTNHLPQLMNMYL